MNPPTFEQYKLITGHMFRRHEIAQWNPEMYLQFFDFVRRYLNDSGKIGVKKQVFIDNEKQILESPPSFHTELLYRVGYFTTTADNRRTQNFQKKLERMTEMVGVYLKMNPAIVTDKIKESLETLPPLRYVLDHYHTVQTKIGAQITMPDNRVLPTKPNALPTQRTPDVILAESQLKIASIIENLTKGLTKDELKKLKATDKISAIAKLWPIVTQARFKPGLAVFQQININRGGREDLEKAMLDFNKIREQ